jgi:hypothetical protein
MKTELLGYKIRSKIGFWGVKKKRGGVKRNLLFVVLALVVIHLTVLSF